MLERLSFRLRSAATAADQLPAKVGRLQTAPIAAQGQSRMPAETAAQMVRAPVLVVAVRAVPQALAQTVATVLAARPVVALVAVDQTAHLQLQAGHRVARQARTVALVLQVLVAVLVQVLALGLQAQTAVVVVAASWTAAPILDMPVALAAMAPCGSIPRTVSEPSALVVVAAVVVATFPLQPLAALAVPAATAAAVVLAARL